MSVFRVAVAVLAGGSVGFALSQLLLLVAPLLDVRIAGAVIGGLLGAGAGGLSMVKDWLTIKKTLLEIKKDESRVHTPTTRETDMIVRETYAPGDKRSYETRTRVACIRRYRIEE